MRALPAGGIARALLWLVGGIVVGFGLIVLISPELVRADFQFLLRLIGVVLVAGLPGVVLLVIVAVRRRRLDVIEGAAHTDRVPTDQDRPTPSDPEQAP